MKPALNQTVLGDNITTIRTWPDAFINTCVTSPPYFALRDYGMDGQIGLEATPEAYVARLVDVFREVHRVLRDDGTLWLNLGDSYAARLRQSGAEHAGDISRSSEGVLTNIKKNRPNGYKEKDLYGIPWMVAFALRADGWYLRQDNIWHKPNPMPESVQDRCTKSHEYMFLLSKSETYFYDHEAIKEKAQPDDASRNGFSDLQEIKRSGNKYRKPASARGVPVDTKGKSNGAVAGSIPWEGTTRNKRSVWTVPIRPFKEAHFATFPPALITPCILAGSPRGGVVLDPFMGAGTTALVAATHGRQFVGCELNPEYKAIADKRVAHELDQQKMF